MLGNRGFLPLHESFAGTYRSHFSQKRSPADDAHDKTCDHHDSTEPKKINKRELKNFQR